jgi:hypothetical protein
MNHLLLIVGDDERNGLYEASAVDLVNALLRFHPRIVVIGDSHIVDAVSASLRIDVDTRRAEDEREDQPSVTFIVTGMDGEEEDGAPADQWMRWSPDAVHATLGDDHWHSVLIGHPDPHVVTSTLDTQRQDPLYIRVRDLKSEDFDALSDLGSWRGFSAGTDARGDDEQAREPDAIDVEARLEALKSSHIAAATSATIQRLMAYLAGERGQRTL